MPFNNIQKPIKALLPEPIFEKFYQKACNTYNAYTHIYDYFWYRWPRKYEEPEERQSIEILKIISPHTMTSREGLLWTRDIVYGIVDDGIQGAFVECGVARGGISAMMAIVAKAENLGRKTWLFDSFEGLPEQSEFDNYKRG